MRAILTLLTLLASFNASAMCLDDYDYKGFSLLKGASVNTPYGVFVASEVVYRGFMTAAQNANEDKKIDSICKYHHGRDFSYANIMEHRLPSRSRLSRDYYIEAYNSLMQKVNLPVIWYSGNTISYACLRPNGKITCDGGRTR